jgi:hypothetical protein
MDLRELHGQPSADFSHSKFFSFESEKVIKKTSVSMFMRGTVYLNINNIKIELR